MWTQRLTRPDTPTTTLLAEDSEELVGFAHLVFDDDPRWGSPLDNLHIVANRKRQRIGSRLLALVARTVTEHGPGGLYVWANQHNTDAQAFYESHGAVCVGDRLSTPPGGVAGRLCGTPVALRYAWPKPDQSVLSPRLASYLPTADS